MTTSALPAPTSWPRCRPWASPPANASRRSRTPASPSTPATHRWPPTSSPPPWATDRLLVAVEGDRVVGFVLLEEVDGRGHVEEVSVHPGGQGAGVGTALLEAARAWAAAAGLDGVTLTTFADVPWNRPWYERRRLPRARRRRRLTPATGGQGGRRGRPRPGAGAARGDVAPAGARPGGSGRAPRPPGRRGRGRPGRAAPVGVEPQHQGAGRLLDGAVHRRRRAARPVRVDPGAPRLDAGVGPRRCSTGSGELDAGRAGGGQRPLRGRHPPQRRHRRGARAPGRPARGLGGQPGAPRRRRRRGAGLHPGRRHPHRPGGHPAAADAADRRGARRLPRRVPHARRAGRRPRRPRSAPTG